MPLILRDTNYAGGTNKNDTLTYSELDGNFVYLDEKIDNVSTTDTGSLLATASVASNTITFTKGDGSTFDITVDTGSGTPTLQQVTDAGATTSNSIIIENNDSPASLSVTSATSGSARLGTSSTIKGYVFIEKEFGSSAYIRANNLTSTRNIQLPDADGTLATFPFTGSAQITGSLGVTGSIVAKGPFSGDTTNHILSIGTLAIAMADMSGSLGNRILPAGYNTYQIYFNESNNGQSKVRLYDMMSSSFIPTTLDPLHTTQITIINDVTGNPGWIVASPGTSIEYAPSQSINIGEYMRLYYDNTPGYDNWRIIERGRLNERTISSGNTNVTQSISGSVRITGSLTVTGSTFLNGLASSSQTSVLTYNSSTGQVFFTASSAIGGGSIPTLQQVTTAGSTTNVGITVSKAGGDYIIIENTSSPKTAYLGTQIGSSAVLGLSNIGGNIGEIYAENITANRTYQLPNQNGTLAVFPYTGSAQITGSLGVTGSISTGFVNAALVKGNQIGVDVDPFYDGTTSILAKPYLHQYFTNAGSSGGGGQTFYYNDTALGYQYDTTGFGDYIAPSLYFIKDWQSFAPTIRINTIISDNASTSLDSLNGFQPGGGNVRLYTYNGRNHVLTVTGSFLARDGVSLGTRISNTHFITGSTNITGSINIVGTQTITGSATITDVLTLPYQDPLPSNKPTGSIAVSGSGATLDGLYLYNGTSWIKLSV